MTVNLDSSFPKATAWARVRMTMLRPRLMHDKHTEKTRRYLERVNLLSKKTHCCSWATPGESQTSSVTYQIGQKLSHTATLSPWCFISCSEAKQESHGGPQITIIPKTRAVI